MRKYTLRKLGKKLTPVMFGVGIALLGNAVEQEAQASDKEVLVVEEVKEDTNLVQEVPKKEITKEEVDTAKQELDKVTSEAKEKQSEVDSTQKEVDNATEEVKEAEKIKVEATEENKQKTQTEIDNKNNSISDKEKEKNTITEEKTKKESEVATQQNEVDKAQAQVDIAQKEVELAKKDVADKQALLDGTNQSEIVKALENAKEQEKQTQQKLEEAKAELEKAKISDEVRRKEIGGIGEELTKARENETQAETDFLQKQKKAEETRLELDNATKEFKKAETDYNSINNITLTPEYISNLKKYMDRNSTLEEEKQAKEVLKSINNELLALNKYKENSNDDNTKLLDVNNLDLETRKNLSLFASDLINQIRKQMGTPETSVTSSSLDFSKKVIDKYLEANFDPWSSIGHYAKGINEVAKEYGLPVSKKEREEQGGQYYENRYTKGYVNSKLTYSQLKKEVYNSILSFMFNGYEWLHAQSIAGINWNNPDEQYVSVNTYVSYNNKGNTLSLNFISINKKDVEKSTKNNFDKTEILNENSKEKITKKYNDTKGKLDSITTKNSIAQKEKDTANTVYRLAKNKVETTITELNNAQAVEEKTPKAVEKLNNAQNNSEMATKKLQIAQENYDNLNADIKTKEQNLTKAKEELATKENVFAGKKEDLNTEQQKLANLQKELVEINNRLDIKNKEIEILKQEIKELEIYLSKLNNADNNLEKAQNKLKEAITRLEKAQSELDKLQKQEKELTEKYNNLQAKYTTQEKIKAEKLVKIQQEQAQNNTKQQKDNKSLSNTGETTQSGIFGVILAILTLGLYRRKQQR